MNTSLIRIGFLSCIIALAVLAGCEQGEPVAPKAGKLNFSFNTVHNGNTRGRIQGVITPAAVSYTLKKDDGSTIDGKIELYEFNGAFVSHPLEVDAGHYSLEQFLVLNTGNQVIYAAPIAGSPLADLVETPLPLSLGVSSEETTTVVPEVIAIDGFKPEDLGYVTFGFEIVETQDFSITTSIADNDDHGPIDYTLEVIAKDAALGTIQWRASFTLSGPRVIHLPTRYPHYTFKAVKPGYITHIQHFPAEELPESHTLNFEFLPEDLEDFIVETADNAFRGFLISGSIKKNNTSMNIAVSETRAGQPPAHRPE